MKKIVVYIPCMAIGLFLVSCSGDNPPPDDPTPSPVVGTWQLTALNINPAQDIDGDGSTTTNILSELDCVSGSLVIKSDGTWNSTFTGVNVTEITNEEFFISCTSSTQTNSGTWQLQSSQLTLFRGTTSTFFMLSSTTLTNSVGEDLPGFKSEVYEKQ